MKVRIRLNVVFTGSGERSHGENRVQRRQAKQFQIGSAETEKGGVEESRALDAVRGHQHHGLHGVL